MSGLAVLAAGLAGFFCMHVASANRPLRAAMVGGLGWKTYMALFGLLSLGCLALIIMGKAAAPHIPLWQPPPAARAVTIAGMLPAMILCAASGLRGHLWRIVHHPMLSGTLVWSLCHLLANGDLASILMFGTFAAYSVFGMVAMTRREAGAHRPIPAYPWGKDGIAIVVGVGLYLLVRWYHFALFGMPVWHPFP